MGAADYKRIAEQLAGRQPNVKELRDDKVEAEGTVTQLQLEIAFDDKLKEMAHLKQGSTPEEKITKRERSIFDTVQMLVVIVYFLISPYC